MADTSDQVVRMSDGCEAERMDFVFCFVLCSLKRLMDHGLIEDVKIHATSNTEDLVQKCEAAGWLTPTDDEIKLALYEIHRYEPPSSIGPDGES